MRKPDCAIALVLVLLVVSGCSVQIPKPSPSGSPAATPTLTSPPIPGDTEQFLADHVGQDYFRQHFTLLHEDVVKPGLVKATYDYTFEPYVTHYQMTLLMDVSRRQLSDEEVSIILLDPQAFEVDTEEAIVIALDNGLSPSESYETSVLLGPMTHNRFAWEVTSPDANPTAEVPEPIFRVVLDVESGDVYTVERIGPMISH